MLSLAKIGSYSTVWRELWGGGGKGVWRESRLGLELFGAMLRKHPPQRSQLGMAHFR